MFQVVTSGLLDPMSSPAPGPQVAGSPAGSGVAAQDVPAPALTPEEEFDLFGPSEDQNPFVGAANSGAASAMQSPVAKASAPLPGTTYVGPQVPMGLGQNLVVELLRNQQEMLRQNQVLMQSMVNRMEREERAREEERAEKLAAKQAEEAASRPSTDPFGVSGYTLGSSSSAAPVPTYTGGNRAEKYLPSLLIIQHGEMGKGRMKEVGEWHRFLEVFVSWLALTDEAYVSEMRHCLKHPNVIEQAKLQSPVAARSAKLFYYLGQCLAKWE